MMSNVNVHPGEQGVDFERRNAGNVIVDRQPAGLNFYKLDWKTSAPGKITVDHGKYTFTIDNALSFMGTESIDLPKEGMIDIDISAGITAPELIAHDEARLKTSAILQRLTQIGWKRYVHRSDPRLIGKDMLEYVLKESNASSLDPRYVPSLDEWMRLSSRMKWIFYADHLYLDVSFTREQTLQDVNKPGSYILNFTLKTESEYFRRYVGGRERDKWKELLPAALAKRPQMRALAEAKKRALGVRIDEDYQDNPVPNFISK